MANTFNAITTGTGGIATTAGAGGNGTAGIVIVYEYA